MIMLMIFISSCRTFNPEHQVKRATVFVTPIEPSPKLRWTIFSETKYVTDLAIDEEGYLWAATLRGVVRWDLQAGLSVSYTVEDGLAGKNVNCLAVVPDGTIWFGTNNGVSHFEDGSWTTYTTEDGLADDRVKDIAVDMDDTLWFATFGGGVSHFDPEGWTTYTTEEGVAENVLNCIAVAPNGVVWVGAADNGISRFDGQTWARYTASHGLVDNETWSILTAPDGTVWASSINGISRYSPPE